MFSSNLKRSVATLGVVAGLLAAAVPASAQIGPATMGNLHTGPGPQIAASEVFELNTFGGNDTLEVVFDVPDYLADARAGQDKIWNNGDGTDVAEAKGTQVGSEGVKPPTPAEPRSAWHQSVVEGQLNTLGGDDSLTVVADAGAGNDTLRADSNEVTVEGLGVVTNNNDPETMGLALREPATITLCHEGFC